MTGAHSWQKQSVSGVGCAHEEKPTARVACSTSRRIQTPCLLLPPLYRLRSFEGDQARSHGCLPKQLRVPPPCDTEAGTSTLHKTSVMRSSRTSAPQNAKVVTATGPATTRSKIAAYIATAIRPGRMGSSLTSYIVGGGEPATSEALVRSPNSRDFPVISLSKLGFDEWSTARAVQRHQILESDHPR